MSELQLTVFEPGHWYAYTLGICVKQREERHPNAPFATRLRVAVRRRALGGGGETPTSGLTGGVNPFGRAADSAPAPAEKEKEKEKEKGKVKAHNTRSPRATRSRK